MNIAVLVSGGVDSSVALRLLHEQGHQLTAFYLKIWLEDELSFLGECPWDDDLRYVREVCEQIGVPLEIVPLQQAYWDRVVNYTITEIKRGRTPNPDIMCNQEVKFGAFYDVINERFKDRHFDKIATGHYAQVKEINGHFHLLCAPDEIKDQTYFLSQLSQEQLSRALFPIGHLHKSGVRALAQKYDIPNKDRKDSQGICFLGKLKFRDFIKHHVGIQKGQFIEYETGAVVGEHEGFWYYTVGQRQGIGLSGGPWYVVAKDVALNTVYISRQYHALDKQRNVFTVGYCNWFVVIDNQMDVDVKMRHGPQRHAAHISRNQDGITWSVELGSRDQGIAAGQFAVFYKGNECLGSGVIV